MGRYEFKVVASGVELSEDQQKRIGQAVSQAGAMAIAQFSEGDPLSVPVSLKHLWIGFPPIELVRDLETHAQQEVGD